VRRVTPDSNVLVSAFMYRRGKPYQLVRMGIEGEINLTVSQAIIEETLEVLVRKFNVRPEELAAYRAILHAAARVVEPAVRLDVMKVDPDDDRILEWAVTAGSDYIVTGDKDLLRLGLYDSIRILTVSDFLEVVNAQARER
jgi:putative PIN family toxin of toxin-antitoxin system